MANWLRAFFQSLTGRFQRFDASIAERYTTFSAAMSLGNNFRFRTDFRMTLSALCSSKCLSDVLPRVWSVVKALPLMPALSRPMPAGGDTTKMMEMTMTGIGSHPQ